MNQCSVPGPWTFLMAFKSFYFYVYKYECNVITTIFYIVWLLKMLQKPWNVDGVVQPRPPLDSALFPAGMASMLNVSAAFSTLYNLKVVSH